MKKQHIKTGARILLGAGLIFAGVGHLSFARRAFRAQVPEFLPLKTDDTVVYSGYAEIALGAALVFSGAEHQKKVGDVAATFFTAVFPGNLAQFVNRKSAFGLDTDGKRLTRLLFQPALVYWALKSTR